jgi:hypothetical protein
MVGRYHRIKKVYTKAGKEMYYIGDGLWFGRVKKDVAEAGMESGEYSLWETIDHRPRRKHADASVNAGTAILVNNECTTVQ